MSPWLGTPAWRSFSTEHGNASISEKNAARHPNGAHATLAASMPEQTEPKIIPTRPQSRIEALCQGHWHATGL